MGRPFLYSLTYGQEGVEHFIESKHKPTFRRPCTNLVAVMKDELETTMRLLGITDLSQCHPKYLNIGDVEHLIPKSLESPMPEIPQFAPRSKL
jgi:L-lactate dehydrogenase (cytochrome)